MLSTAFSSGQMTTYNVYQLKIHEFLSINVILREGYLLPLKETVCPKDSLLYRTWLFFLDKVNPLE